IADAEPAVMPTQAARASPRGAETILLAEDDVGVRALVAAVVRWNGYVVLEAPDGEQALEIATTSAAPIHLLLTDVVMPGMRGRFLFERVTALRPATRLLFM